VNWRVGIAGSPVSHSLSPRLHDIGLRLAGLNGTSTRVEIDLLHATDLKRLLGTAFDALSVTSPLKRAAYELCDELVRSRPEPNRELSARARRCPSRR